MRRDGSRVRRVVLPRPLATWVRARSRFGRRSHRSRRGCHSRVARTDFAHANQVAAKLRRWRLVAASAAARVHCRAPLAAPRPLWTNRELRAARCLLDRQMIHAWLPERVPRAIGVRRKADRGWMSSRDHL